MNSECNEELSGYVVEKTESNATIKMIKVSKETHKALKVLIAKKELNTFDDAISYLIQNQKES